MDKNTWIGGGVIPRPKNIRNYDYNVCCASNTSNIENESLPSEYTIPEKNIPEVHNQEWTMQCVSYALCECAESRKKQLGEDVHFSTPWTYGRKEIRGDYKGEGLYPDVATKGTLKLGFLELPYFNCEVDVPDVLDMTAERNDLLPLSQTFKPKAYYEINYAIQDKKWETFKRALVETERPVVIISDTFFKGGSHATIGIGYTEELNGVKGRYVYFQNSWGKEYKDNGRYYMPFYKVDGIYVLGWDELKLPFTDVLKDEWYYDSIKHSYFAGLINGVSDTKFEPDENMIRGDMAIIIERAMKKIETSINAYIRTQIQFGKQAHLMAYKTSNDCTVSFKDVSKSDYYYDAINYVCANDIMSGIENNVFAPTDAITRAEVATIVSRLVKNTAYILYSCLGVNITLPNNSIQKYSDVYPGDWYCDYIYAAQSYGLMNGESDNIFAPNDNITRAEGSAVLCRTFKAIENLFMQI